MDERIPGPDPRDGIPVKEDPPAWAKVVGLLIVVALAIVVLVLLAALGGAVMRVVRWGLEGW